MAVKNRSVLRTKLKQLIDASCVGTGKVFQVCYAYQKSEFDTPNDVSVCVITSNRSQRQNPVSDVIEANQYVFLNVHTFIAYEKYGDNNDVQWSEAQSEDAIDLAEASLSSVFIQNADRTSEDNPEWLTLELVDSSEINSVFMEGVEYRHEVFYLRFMVEMDS